MISHKLYLVSGSLPCKGVATLQFFRMGTASGDHNICFDQFVELCPVRSSFVEFRRAECYIFAIRIYIRAEERNSGSSDCSFCSFPCACCGFCYAFSSFFCVFDSACNSFFCVSSLFSLGGFLIVSRFCRIASGSAGSSLKAANCASKLLDWGTATNLTDDEIYSAVGCWLDEQSDERLLMFFESFYSVYTQSYNLRSDNAEALMLDAGISSANYPWGDEAAHAVEMVYYASGLR